jgi:multidrug transporter EmrE-like cation transporter
MLIVALIGLSVLLSVSAQILLKHGMSHPAVSQGLQTGVLDAVWSIFTNFSILFGLSAYVASAGFWLLVLSKLDVSKAYPFVGLGFILTMLFAYFFLNEPLTTTKIAGTLCVCAGIILISLE